MQFLITWTVALFLALLPAFPSLAHEFWIQPLRYQYDLGEDMAANLRVGQDFEGSPMSYIPRNFTRFEFSLGTEVTAVRARMATNPAFQVAAEGEGLGIILHETSDREVAYNEWDRFLRFADHKDFPDIAARQAARGLPQTGFDEVYTRHAKSLIALGHGAGADRAFGLVTEFVALANPYTDDLSGGMPVRLLFQGTIRADAQVELFERAPDGTLSVTYHRTGETGEVTLPVQPGHEYMVDAVVLEEAAANIEDGPVWRTYWANLTFATPNN